MGAIFKIWDEYISPAVDLEMDIGSTLLRFKDLYLGGDAYLDSIIATTITLSGNVVLGSASTSTLTCTGRLILRTLATEPIWERPAGSTNEIAYYSGRLYYCIDGSIPEWKRLAIDVIPSPSPSISPSLSESLSPSMSPSTSPSPSTPP